MAPLRSPAHRERRRPLRGPVPARRAVGPRGGRAVARPVQPEWLGPPAGELGGVVPLGLVLARSELGVVALSHAIAYSTGVAFDLVAQAGGLTPRSAQASSTTSTPGGSAATSCPRASCGSGSSFPTDIAGHERRLALAAPSPDRQPFGPALDPARRGRGPDGQVDRLLERELLAVAAPRRRRAADHVRMADRRDPGLDVGAGDSRAAHRLGEGRSDLRRARRGAVRRIREHSVRCRDSGAGDEQCRGRRERRRTGRRSRRAPSGAAIARPGAHIARAVASVAVSDTAGERPALRSVTGRCQIRHLWVSGTSRR